MSNMALIGLAEAIIISPVLAIGGVLGAVASNEVGSWLGRKVLDQANEEGMSQGKQIAIKIAAHVIQGLGFLGAAAFTGIATIGVAGCTLFGAVILGGTGSLAAPVVATAFFACSLFMLAQRSNSIMHS